MAEKRDEINYKKMAVPTTPPSSVATVNDLQLKKGGSLMKSPPLDDNVVKDGSKGKSN
jgi:hypothetical protein